MPPQPAQPALSAAVIKRKAPLRRRMAQWWGRAWRPAASVVVLCSALAIGWRVANGNNGLSTWQQKRVEDQRLRKEIADLEQENARLKTRVQRLDTDDETIAHEAREKLQYVGEGEVIFKLPPKAADSASSAK